MLQEEIVVDLNEIDPEKIFLDRFANALKIFYKGNQSFASYKRIQYGENTSLKFIIKLPPVYVKILNPNQVRVSITPQVKFKLDQIIQRLNDPTNNYERVGVHYVNRFYETESLQDDNAIILYVKEGIIDASEFYHRFLRFQHLYFARRPD